MNGMSSMNLDRRRFLWTSSAAALAMGGAPGLAWAGPTAAAGSDRSYPRPALKAPGERVSLNQGWRFHLGDIPFPKIKGHGWSYANAKAGSAWGAASPD